MQVQLAVHICVLIDFNLSQYVLGFGFLVTRSSILILIFQREVLYKYAYCHVVFVIFEKFKIYFFKYKGPSANFRPF